MDKVIEAVGKTEEAAIASALAELGKSREEVSVEILSRAKSGFLGIGASPARVRVTYTHTESLAEKTESFLKGLLERMGSDAVPVVEEREDGGVYVNLTGEKIGALIGRRGETLDAIQHLTSFVVNRGREERVHVSVDAESYRVKREESLERLAKKVAGKVIKYRRDMTLEPMNSYERHVIHATLQDFEGVSTYSVGSEPHRRIVVAYGTGRQTHRK